jgi:hypothetical protein
LIPRNSVYCQKAPKNSELKGLVQKQDPANGPLLFFDHLVTTNGSTVLLDSQPNTRPFGGAFNVSFDHLLPKKQLG